MILIDGKKAAAELREKLKQEVLELKTKHNKFPGLTVILIGAVVLVVFLTTIDTFLAGFCSASLVWNWKRWIFTPLDTLLDALWPDNSGD